MLVNTIRAEFTKLITTASFRWTTGLFFVFSLLWAFFTTRLTSLFDGAPAVASASIVVSGLLWLNLSVLMIQAIMVITTEYRYNLPTPLYLANPHRAQVAVAKLVLYAVIAAILMFIGIVACLGLAQLMADEVVGFDNIFADPVAQRALWAYPVGTALMVVFAQGLALLLRQSAGTIAVGLILFWGVDNLIQFVPKVGEKLMHFSPFNALRSWLTDTAGSWSVFADNSHWYLVVFVLWAAILWLGGVAALVKRDV